MPVVSQPRQAATVLLEQIDGFVRNDPAPCDLNGLVCIVVSGAGGPRIWHGAFAGRALGSGLLPGVPPDADAILLLDETQAADIVDGKPPAPGARLFGDLALLEDFIARYCTHTPMHVLRAGPAGKGR